MKVVSRTATVAVLVLGLVLAVVAVRGGTATAYGGTTKAVLRLADGTRVGTVHFDHRRHLTQVRVNVDLPRGVTELDDFHGFHVHANNDPANGRGCLADPTMDESTWFVSADGHYAKEGQVHGEHAGDLPSLLLAANGRSYSTFTTGRLSPREVLGKAVILHDGRDNFGNVPVGTAPDQYTPNSPAATDLTDRTGNAGARIACGVITRD